MLLIPRFVEVGVERSLRLLTVSKHRAREWLFRVGDLGAGLRQGGQGLERNRWRNAGWRSFRGGYSKYCRGVGLYPPRELQGKREPYGLI